MSQEISKWEIVFSTIKLQSNTLSVEHDSEVDYREATERVINEMYGAPKRLLEFDAFTDQLDVYVRYGGGGAVV